MPSALLTLVAIAIVLVPLSREHGLLRSRETILLTDQKNRLMRRRIAALTALLFIPLFSVGFYLELGRPFDADKPLAQREQANLDQADPASLIARLERHLQTHGADAEGWLVLAQNYRLANRPQDAVRAYRQLIALNGEQIPLLLGLGEALIETQNGTVDSEAKTIFLKVLQKHPRHPEAQFYLALVKAQKGDVKAAMKDLKTLLDAAPEKAPWRRIVQKEIDRMRMAEAQK